MLKFFKIALILCICCSVYVCYAAYKTCDRCGIYKRKDVIERVVSKKKFNNNWGEVLKHYSKEASTDKGARCFIDHLYKYGLYNRVDKKLQIECLQNIANRMYPSDKARFIEPLVLVIADEEDIFNETTQKLQDPTRNVNYYVMDQTLESLARRYKIKGKGNKDILVRAYRTKYGYIALLDKKAAWENFNLAERYETYKNYKWCAYMFHPHSKNLLIPKDCYDDEIYSEKWNAFRSMCQQLGAKTVKFGYFRFNDKKVGTNAELTYKIQTLGQISLAYNNSRKNQQRINTQTILEFKGAATPQDPRKNKSLEAWIKNNSDWDALCNRRMNSLNPLTSETIIFAYQRKYNFDLNAGVSIKELWGDALIKSIGIKIAAVEKVEWSMEIKFPQVNVK